MHEDFKAKFAENDTHVLFVPKGLTWYLQPLDCGFFKVYKDNLKKKWIQSQQTVFINEKAKRAALSNILKETYALMLDNDNTVFWKKAELEPPHVFINRLDQEAMNSSMLVENEGDGNGNNDDDDNLFAE